MNTFYWVLYDFANSFLSAALEGIYFSQWVVIDNKFADIWYGGTFALATLILLFTAPFLGSWSDAYGKKMPFLRILTTVIVASGIVLGITANSSLPVLPKVILALVCFLFVQYFYQASLTFYNPLLNQLSKKNNRGLVSGLGQIANNLGFVVATGIFLLLSNGRFSLFGSPGRNQVFLPAAILFGILSLPMLVKFKEKVTNQIKIRTINLSLVYKNTISGIKELVGIQKNVGIFLLGFMLISDAILTANLFFAIFMEQVYKIPDGQKFILLSLMSLLVIPSCYISGKLGDKFGLKKILILACITLMVSFTLISLSTSIYLLYILILLVGLGWGGYYTTARAILVTIAPKDRIGEYFGFYSTFQRFASVIGPLTWGGITLLLVNLGTIRYRIAVMALVLLMFIGTILLTKVVEKDSTESRVSG